MKKIFAILLFLMVAGGIGYAVGVNKNAPRVATPNTSVASMPAVADEPMSSSHVHAVMYDADGNLLLGRHGGLFKSTDGGKTWNKMDVTGSVNSDDWMSLTYDPRNPNIIFAGGHDLGVIKSMDGGKMWMRADQGIKGTDIHGLTINQRNPDMLLAYSVGNGVFKSEDNGNSWKRMDDGPDNPGVRSLAYMAVQTGMDKSMGWDNWGLLFAGTADGLYQSFSCFCGWTKVSSVFDNTTLYTLATLHQDLTVMYAGTKDGVFRTEDSGVNWRKLDNLAGVKITGLAINPKNPAEVTAVTEDGMVYQTSDSGKTFVQMAQP